VIDVVCLKMNLPHDQGKSSDRQRRKVCKWGIYLLRKGTKYLPIPVVLWLIKGYGRQNSAYRTVLNAFVLSSLDAYIENKNKNHINLLLISIYQIKIIIFKWCGEG
jgi:hypothetical protein